MRYYRGSAGLAGDVARPGYPRFDRYILGPDCADERHDKCAPVVDSAAIYSRRWHCACPCHQGRGHDEG